MSQYQHEACFYAGPDGFLAALAPIVAEAVAAEEPTLVAARAEQLELLHSSLPSQVASSIEWVDMAMIGRNPATIIAVWHGFVERYRDSGRNLRGIGEPIYPARTVDELDECHRHEALLNLAIPSEAPLRLVCPYDTETLAPDVLARARSTHPHVTAGGVSGPSDAYDLDELTQSVFRGPVRDPPEHATRFAVSLAGGSALRRTAGACAERLGLPGARVFDLQLVVSELATNSMRHGGGGGQLWVWREGQRIVVQTRDRGVLTNPLVGRTPPSHEQPGGRGLWIVNQLCDLLQLRAVGDMTVATAHFPLVAPA